MSTTQQLGADRCMMEEPQKRFGTFVRGSVNIRAKLAQRWTILDSERNHLTEDYGVKPTDDDIEQALANSVEVKGVFPNIKPVKNKGGRPRKNP